LKSVPPVSLAMRDNHYGPVAVARNGAAFQLFRVADGKQQHVIRLRGFDGFHHAMAAGIIFAVAEDDEGLAAAPGRRQPAGPFGMGVFSA